MWPITPERLPARRLAVNSLARSAQGTRALRLKISGLVALSPQGGVSPQGGGKYVAGQRMYTQRNLSFHHNIVGHAEYCFEIWSQGKMH